MEVETIIPHLHRTNNVASVTYCFLISPSLYAILTHSLTHLRTKSLSHPLTRSLSFIPHTLSLHPPHPHTHTHSTPPHTPSPTHSLTLTCLLSHSPLPTQAISLRILTLSSLLSYSQDDSNERIFEASVAAEMLRAVIRLVNERQELYYSFMWSII